MAADGRAYTPSGFFVLVLVDFLLFVVTAVVVVVVEEEEVELSLFGFWLGGTANKRMVANIKGC